MEFQEVVIQIMGGVAEVVKCPVGIKVTIIDHDIDELETLQNQARSFDPER